MTDEELSKMTKQEQNRRFKEGFNFNTDMLTSKVLLVDSHFTQTEVVNLQVRTDDGMADYLHKLLQC